MARRPVPRLMTYKEAEAMTKLSHDTLRRLVNRGVIKAVDVGGSPQTRRLVVDSVEAHLRRMAR